QMQELSRFALLGATRLGKRCCLLAIAAAGALPVHAATSVSRSSAAGSWSDPTGWTPMVVPNNNGGNLFDVTISSGTGAALDIDPTIEAFTLGGSLDADVAPHALTVNQVFTWTGFDVNVPSQIGVDINASG